SPTTPSGGWRTACRGSRGGRTPASSASAFRWGVNWLRRRGADGAVGAPGVDPRMLERMLRLPVDDDRSLLAVDAGEVAPELAAEATKVRRDGAPTRPLGQSTTSLSPT